MRRVSPLLFLSLYFFGQFAHAESSVDQMMNICLKGNLPIHSPKEVLNRHGIKKVDDACPFQSAVDENKECQSSVTIFQDLYDSLGVAHKDTCDAATAAAQRAREDCQSQQSCLQAQQAALEKYRKAIQLELGYVTEYRTQARKVLNYAISEIAGGAVSVLHDLNADRHAKDNLSTHGPDGHDWASHALHAQNNQDAFQNGFRGEDEKKAEAIVKGFADGKGRDSDLTGIKSELIREPLQVALAGRDMQADLGAYQRTLESQTAAITGQTGKLANGARALSNLPNSDRTAAPVNSMEAPATALAPAPTAANPNSLSRNLDGLTAMEGAAANAAPLLAGSKSPSGEGSGTWPANGRQAGSASVSGAGSASAAASDAAPSEPANPDSPVASPENARGALAKRGPATISGSAGSESHLARLKKLARLDGGASPGGSTQPAGVGALVGAGDGVSSPGAVSAVEPGTPASAFSPSGPSGGFGSEGIAAGGLPPPTVGEGTEKAVQNIVGSWEKALNPDPEPLPVSAATELALADPSQSLFSRIRVAMERAQKRGSVQRVPGKL